MGNRRSQRGASIGMLLIIIGAFSLVPLMMSFVNWGEYIFVRAKLEDSLRACIRAAMLDFERKEDGTITWDGVKGKASCESIFVRNITQTELNGLLDPSDLDREQVYIKMEEDGGFRYLEASTTPKTLKLIFPIGTWEVRVEKLKGGAF